MDNSKTNIERMKETGCLHLSKLDLFQHYFIVIFLLAPFFYASIYEYYQNIRYNNDFLKLMESLSIIILWITPAIAFYLLQKRRLKLKILPVTIDAATFKKIAEQAGGERNWIFTCKTNDYIEATREEWSLWGERITIVRDKNRILINSICDPDQRVSVGSFGSNKLNIQSFEKVLIKHQDVIHTL